ncbi:HEPN domain-containing protein [Thiohalocapsa marina]|uniref:HEPN domain-containing protein n=1 Tax=Thiohalocapsa marina TaxID=424902 RepID=UPI0036DC9383
MSGHNAQAQALIDAGLRDRLSLSLLLDTGQAPQEVLGFHAQQACEKFIKAALVLHGIVFERTHDLSALASLCRAHGMDVPADPAALRLLNNFAVRFRYEACSLPLIDAKQALTLVDTLKAWAALEIERCAGSNPTAAIPRADALGR